MNFEGTVIDEIYVSKESDTTTYYFIAPKEMLKQYVPYSDYPEAISMEISIEFPSDHIEPAYGLVAVSPTKENEEGGCEDYDWTDINMPYEDINKLIRLVEGKE